MVNRRSGLSRAAHVVRWLVHTPWPVLALDMLRANLVGALFTFAFLRFGMPKIDAISLSQYNAVNQLSFGLYLFFAIIVGIYLTITLSMPVLIWHRRRTRLDDSAARRRALNLPMLLTLVNLGLWTVGGLFLAGINLFTSAKDFVLVIIITLIIPRIYD